MACPKIYMNGAASIGATTIIAGNRSMKDLYGKDVGEKFDSAWRNYFAGIAEKSGHPPALARAMATKEIVVIEVERKGKKYYIEPHDKKEGDKELREICKDGEIMTLTAMEAEEYGLAEAIYDSRDELLSALGYGDAQVVPNEELVLAQKDYEVVLKKLEKIYAKLLQYRMTYNIEISVNPKAARETLQKLIKRWQYLKRFAEVEPDVPVDTADIEYAIAYYQAIYDGLKVYR